MPFVEIFNHKKTLKICIYTFFFDLEKKAAFLRGEHIDDKFEVEQQPVRSKRSFLQTDFISQNFFSVSCTKSTAPICHL